MTSFYDEDLAAIHHEGFGALALGAAPALLAALREAGFARGRIVDLGCGGGLWLRELVRAGYEALGVDVSPALVALARRTAPEAEVREGSAFDAELPRCVAVTALGEVLCYRAPGTGAPSLGPLARRVFSALEPGGLFVFDVMVRELRPLPATRSWRAGDDWAVLTESAESPDRTHLTRRIITFRKDPARTEPGQEAGYRRAEETHVQVLRPAGEIARLLEAEGFEVGMERHHGAHALALGRMAFTARKPRRR